MFTYLMGYERTSRELESYSECAVDAELSIQQMIEYSESKSFETSNTKKQIVSKFRNCLESTSKTLTRITGGSNRGS